MRIARLAGRRYFVTIVRRFLLVLIACVIPAFMGETHFAFKGYSLNFKQTPAKREMDYLRIVGGSKESAKELKLFGLANYLVGRYTKLSNELHAQNVNLAKRRLLVGTGRGRARGQPLSLPALRREGLPGSRVALAA